MTMPILPVTPNFWALFFAAQSIKKKLEVVYSLIFYFVRVKPCNWKHNEDRKVHDGRCVTDR